MLGGETQSGNIKGMHTGDEGAGTWTVPYKASKARGALDELEEQPGERYGVDGETEEKEGELQRQEEWPWGPAAFCKVSSFSVALSGDQLSTLKRYCYKSTLS